MVDWTWLVGSCWGWMVWYGSTSLTSRGGWTRRTGFPRGRLGRPFSPPLTTTFSWPGVRPLQHHHQYHDYDGCGVIMIIRALSSSSSSGGGLGWAAEWSPGGRTRLDDSFSSSSSSSSASSWSSSLSSRKTGFIHPRRPPPPPRLASIPDAASWPGWAPHSSTLSLASFSSSSFSSSSSSPQEPSAAGEEDDNNNEIITAEEDSLPRPDPTRMTPSPLLPRRHHHPKKIQHLPRLYVGPRPPPRHQIHSGAEWIALIMNTTTPNDDPAAASWLYSQAMITLPSDQAHYVTKVLRLTPHTDPAIPPLGVQRKKSSSSSTSFSSNHHHHNNKNNNSYLRLFDGRSGEWLAQFMAPVVTPAPAPGRKSPARRPPVEALVQCLAPLRSQSPDSKTSSSSSSSSCWLCVAPIKKKERWQWMVEKCTELGVDGFIFLQTDRTEATVVLDVPDHDHDDDDDYHHHDPENPKGASFKTSSCLSLDKCLAYAVEAAEQSERLQVPHVVTVGRLNSPDNDHPAWPPSLASRLQTPGRSAVMTPLARLLALALSSSSWSTTSAPPLSSSDADNTTTPPRMHWLVCRERKHSSSRPLGQVLRDIHGQPGPVAVCFLIGPEGGWSPEEEDLLEAMEKEHLPPGVWESVSLGPYILRAETAAMTAMAAWTLFQDAHQQQRWPVSDP